MDFKQLEYFRAVVHAGSVSQAAKNLGMTQPPISTSIARLEQSLGVQLLERTAKGVRPTAAGLHLLAQGNRLLRQRDRLEETMNLMGEGAVGEIRVGVEPMVISEFIADVLSDFLDEAPGARVSLVDVTPDAILRGVQRGDLDLGCVPFGIERCSEVVTDICDHLPVAELPVLLAVPSHRVQEHHPNGYGWGRWILPRPLPGFSGFPEDVQRALRDEEGFEVIEVSTPQTALSFVAAGLGVSPVTERMGENRRGVSLVPAPDWIGLMEATLLWRKDVEITPLMERWMTATRAIAGQLSP